MITKKYFFDDNNIYKEIFYEIRMKIGGIKKRGVRLQILLIFILLVISFSFVSAGDVAYIYDKSFRIDQNVINIFQNFGLTVDLVENDNIALTDFSQYRILYVGDERFSNAAQIPVNNF